MKGGGGCSWTYFNSHNSNTVDPMSKAFMIFWKLKRDFQMMCQNFVGTNFRPWTMGHGVAKLANSFIAQYELWWQHLKGLFLSLDLRNSSYGSWKSPPNHWCTILRLNRGGGSWSSFNSHNFSTVTHTHTHTHTRMHTHTLTHTHTHTLTHWVTDWD